MQPPEQVLGAAPPEQVEASSSSSPIMMPPTRSDPLLLPLPPHNTRTKKLLMLVSNQSLQRQVTIHQQKAHHILNAHKINHTVIDGADAACRDRRNELFQISGLGAAYYPQFFVIHNNNNNNNIETTFWGDWQAFDTANETGALLDEFGNNELPVAAAAAAAVSSRTLPVAAAAAAVPLLLEKTGGTDSTTTTTETADAANADTDVGPDAAIPAVASWSTLSLRKTVNTTSNSSATPPVSPAKDANAATAAAAGPWASTSTLRTAVSTATIPVVAVVEAPDEASSTETVVPQETTTVASSTAAAVTTPAQKANAAVAAPWASSSLRKAVAQGAGTNSSSSNNNGTSQDAEHSQGSSPWSISSLRKSVSMDVKDKDATAPVLNAVASAPTESVVPTTDNVAAPSNANKEQAILPAIDDNTTAFSHVPEHGFSLFLAKRAKTIHFIRHAEGQHNAANQAAGDDSPVTYSTAGSWRYQDAKLTCHGIQQCLDIRSSALLHDVHPELIVVSPFTRTLQTAHVLFGGGGGGGGHIPFLVHDLARERSGKFTCDKRRTRNEIVSELEPVYRYTNDRIDFDSFGYPTAEDGEWTEQRESSDKVTARGIHFMQWLASRPETEIAVVTHSSWLKHLFRAFGENIAHTDQQALHRLAGNAEVRSVCLALHRGFYPNGEWKDGEFIPHHHSFRRERWAPTHTQIAHMHNVLIGDEKKTLEDRESMPS